LTSHERITVLPLDITSRESTESLVSELTRRGVDLDVVVCNAGVHYPGPLLDADIDADVADGHGIAQDAFDANVWGYLRTVKAVVPEMARRAKGGLVVTIGSCAEIVPSPFAGEWFAGSAGQGGARG
jgi:NADP-dependent 3-hydroxy acid dehydrogenase YdfG